MSQSDAGARVALLSAVLAGLEGGESDYERPWLGWLLICLVRQRERQRWLMHVRRTHLVDLDEDGGEVPGLPDWRYQFHGVGLLLSGPGGEALDVDFHLGDPDGRTMDPHFFATRLLSLSQPELPERRAREWLLGSRALVVAALDELRCLGLIGHPTSRHVFELDAEYAGLWDRLAQVDWSGAGPSWCRALNDPAGERPGAGNAEFARWSLGLVRRDRGQARILADLVGVVDPKPLSACARELYDGPVDSGIGRAIEALMALGGAPGPAEVALAGRLDPERHNPFTACRLARWFFQAGSGEELAVQLIEAFSACRQSPGFRGNPFDDEYAILALEFRPELAPPLVAQALRSRVPSAAHGMGALLSLLGDPWCAEALLEAARESQDAQRTRFLLGCLSHFEDPVVTTQARALMPPPPEFEAGAIGYTGEQVAFLNLRQEVEWKRSHMQGVLRRLRPQ